MLKTTLIFCLGISLFSCSDMVTNQDQIEKNISQNQTLAKITSHDIFSYWDMDKWGSMKGTYLPYWHDMDFVNKPGISSSYPNYTWELTVYEGSIPYTSDRIALAQAITPYWNTYGGYPLRVGDYANLTSYKIRYYNNG